MNAFLDNDPDVLNAKARAKFQELLILVLLPIFVMWTIKIIEIKTSQSFASWGLYPRTLKGLWGIVTMPFLHGDMDHLVSNSFGCLTLGLLLGQFYEKVGLRVTFYSAVFSSILVWIIARDAYHIGASAVIYAYCAFLFLSAVLRRDKRSMGAGLIVVFLFGASVWGVLPFYTRISWEGHLCGALVGSFLAVRYRSIDLPARYLEDDTEYDDHFEDQMLSEFSQDYFPIEPEDQDVTR